MFLFIDTSDPGKTLVGLLDIVGSFKDSKEWVGRQNQSEELLSEVDLLLKKNGINKKSIDKLVVISGPGSYTGLRVGISTANALAFAWGIPILGITSTDWQRQEGLADLLTKADDQPVKAFYLNAPHITSPKKR